VQENRSQNELRAISVDTIQDRLEQIDGVALSRVVAIFLVPISCGKTPSPYSSACVRHFYRICIGSSQTGTGDDTPDERGIGYAECGNDVGS
jgi:hypothetical protein